MGLNDARFLKFYAKHVRAGTERCIDLPSIVASVLDGIAERNMAEIPIITFDHELVGTDAMDAVSKAFADLKAKKPFIVLPKGAELKMVQVPDAPAAPVEVRVTVEPTPGARRIDLE